MTSLPNYRAKYAHFAHLERTIDGVLTMRLHTNDGEWILAGAQGRDLVPDLLTDLGLDPENRVVIITGTGLNFCTQSNPQDLQSELDHFGIAVTELWRRGGNNGLSRLLDLEAIVIWALNGPVSIHPDFWAGADLILAAEHASIQDGEHLAAGMAPGGDSTVVWETLLGHSRAKYFQLTGQVLSAQELHTLGVVHEVLPADQLLARANEHAQQLVKLTPAVLRYTKINLNQRLRRHLLLEQPYGQALVMLGAHSIFKPDAPR